MLRDMAKKRGALLMILLRKFNVKIRVSEVPREKYAKNKMNL